MPSRSGFYAVALVLQSILQDHLQDEVDAIRSAEAITEAITAPDATDGYAIGRILPVDRASACRIWRLRTGPRLDIVQQHGGPIREPHRIEVRFRYGATTIQQTDAHLWILARAAKTVLLERWRPASTAAGAAMRMMTVEIADESVSIFAQDRVEGLTTRGRPPQHTQSEIALMIDCVQSVYSPINASA